MLQPIISEINVPNPFAFVSPYLNLFQYMSCCFFCNLFNVWAPELVLVVVYVHCMGNMADLTNDVYMCYIYCTHDSCAVFNSAGA